MGIPTMFHRVFKMVSELNFAKMAQLMCDIQERYWRYSQHASPPLIWYLEIPYDLVAELHRFKCVVGDHHTYLRWVLGVEFSEDWYGAH